MTFATYAAKLAKFDKYRNIYFRKILLLNVFGGRGRNRTYNLSVKSRALRSRSRYYRLL